MDALARCDAPVVPVLISDHGVDMALVDHALRCAVYPALMLDTVDKHAGSLLQRVSGASLRAFVAAVRSRSVLCGLAGALRADDVPQLRALAPHFAGFRSAVCAGERDGALDAHRVRALRTALRNTPAANALKLLKNSIRIDPNCGVAYLYAGQVQAILGNKLEGEAYINRAMSLLPGDPRPGAALKTIR